VAFGLGIGCIYARQCQQNVNRRPKPAATRLKAHRVTTLCSVAPAVSLSDGRLRVRGGDGFEHAARVRVREGPHVADRRASCDAIEEDFRERVEPLLQVGRGKAADLDLLGHCRRDLSRPPRTARTRRGGPPSAWAAIVLPTPLEQPEGEIRKEQQPRESQDRDPREQQPSFRVPVYVGALIFCLVVWAAAAYVVWFSFVR